MDNNYNNISNNSVSNNNDSNCNMNNGFNATNMINNNNGNNYSNLNNNGNIQNNIDNNIAKKTINKNAILSITFSLISMFIFWWLSLAGISAGVIALREIKAKNQKGKILAIIGIIIGIISEGLYWYTQIISK